MSLTPDQVAFRRGKIGSSTIATLVCDGEVDAWLACTGRDQREQTDAMSLGHEFEAPIIAAFARRVKPAHQWGATIIHPSVPWAVATMDGRTDDGEEIVETKFVGRWMADRWGTGDDGAPMYPVIQLCWQLGISGLRSGYIAAMIGGPDFRAYPHAFDAELFDMLLARADRFMREFVLTDIPPEPDGSDAYGDYLKARFAKASDGMTLGTDEHRAIVERVIANKAIAKPLEKRIKADEQLLKLAIGDAKGICGDGWEATWKPDVNGNRRLNLKLEGKAQNDDRAP
jgi:predicted phage-related endonuclease